ncbi:conserved hypothetical protein [Clostridium neonatale]|uniref:IS66 family insertion sequence element accessory protein TnpA n=1 Tax=Clostridium TaxID=1485 RepID=UPI00290D4882|nr:MULTISPECIES: hypothetical protein [Clostridium]MDU4849461.1 hypothetical protein [Clostridium sp.]CAI3246713.1 conserved hypothetical protein [Clostridium neonatale]CAI3650609.1 conserved hypothetical protein [Clostridium neonatale]
MSEIKDIDWKEMIEKLSSYQGTIRDFCKENNLPERKFYYHRRRLANTNKTIFHGISLKSESNSIAKHSDKPSIKIEIGNARIYIPANEIAVLSAIIKNLSSNV